jgi:hypothetical protein
MVHGTREICGTERDGGRNCEGVSVGDGQRVTVEFACNSRRGCPDRNADNQSADYLVGELDDSENRVFI